MRNLKKILALVLALVMSLSLMATASAAETETAATGSKYQTAIDVLKGLGVVWGDDRGDRPADPITRAEVAALLYRIDTTDVTDAQKAIHTGQGFTDVNVNDWYAGYVSYCYIAEIIKGNPNGTFEPDNNINGYATLAMILRAMGYGKNGEFVGDGWEIRTASTAKQIGILDGISDTQLSGPAARELVFEILFRALLKDVVDFDARMPYQYPSTGVTLGYKQFKLEEIEGVVVGNEFADLNSNQVLPEGKTQLETEDGIRNLSVTTEITDIGESRYAYITGSKVLAMGDTGKNTVTGTEGKACDIGSASKFASVAGMPAASDIEYYVNFDRTGHYDCDQRLEFVVKFELKKNDSTSITYKPNSNTQTYATLDEIVTDFENRYVGGADLRTSVGMTVVAGSEAAGSTTVTYSKIVRAKDEITQADMNVIKGIFYAADNQNSTTTLYQGVEGDVYVGTRSNKADDIDWSDELSYTAWTDRFINDVSYDINWNTSVNGDWVKFVDNDNDGYAEYAFKTHYNLEEALYTYTDRDGNVVMEFNTFDDEYEDVRYLNDYTPSVGDKVLAALIDNQWLVEPANSETVVVSSYSWRNDEITTDKGTYGQSGIENETDMLEEIDAMEDKVEYVVYFDHFGYVRAYELPGGTKYALITEMYYTNGNQGNLVKNWPMTAELTTLDDEGNKVTDEYNVVSGADTFTAAQSWMRVRNNVATYNYNNWVQPAIAHLGVAYKTAAVDYTAHKGTPAFTATDSNAEDTVSGTAYVTFWDANRQLVRSLDNMTGCEEFNWGVEAFVGVSALNSSKGYTFSQPATASFTNVAVVGIDGNNATLAGAATLGLNKDGTVADAPYTYARDYIQLARTDIAAKAVRYDIADIGDVTLADGTVVDYKDYNNNWVNAVHDTQYFIAYNGGVYAVKDFENFPGLNNKENKIHAAYAVARNTASDNADKPYWVADVIVYEVYDLVDNLKQSSVSLAFYTPTRTSGNVQEINTLNSKYGPEVTLIPGGRAWNVPAGQWGVNWEGYGFYALWNDTAAVDDVMTAADITRIGAANKDGSYVQDYSKNNIHAGTIVREAYIDHGGEYIDVALNDAQTKIASIEITNKIYSITNGSALSNRPYNYNEATLLRYEKDANSQVLKGDKVIWVGEAKTNGTKSATNFVVDLGSVAPSNIYAGNNILNDTPTWLISWTKDSLGNYTITPYAGADADSGEWQKIMREQDTTPTSDTIKITFKFTSTDPNFAKDDVVDTVLKGTEVKYNLSNTSFVVAGWTSSTPVVKKGSATGVAGTDYTWSSPDLTLPAAYTDGDITVEIPYSATTASFAATITNGTGTAIGASDITWAVNGATNNMGTAPTSSAPANLKYGDVVTLTWTGTAHDTYTLTTATAADVTAGGSAVAAGSVIPAPTTGDYSIAVTVKGATSLTITANAETPVTVTGMTDTAVTAWTTGTSNATTAATYYAGDKLTNVEPTVVAANYDVTGMYWTDDNGTTKHAMTKDAATGKWSSTDAIGSKAVAVYAQTVSKNVTVTVEADTTGTGATVGTGKPLVAFSIAGANATGTAQTATVAGTMTIARGSDLKVTVTDPATGGAVWVLVTGTVGNAGTNGYNSVTVSGISENITIKLFGTQDAYDAAVAALS